MSIDRGDTRRLKTSILEGTTPTDPDALTLTVRDPAGVSTTYVYGVDMEIVRDAVGVYHVDLLLNQTGSWTAQWQSTEPTQVQGDTLLVAPAPLDALTPPTGTYTTPNAVRYELGASSALSDEDATRLILDAEDAIDGILGGWWPDETTGRKVTQDRVMAWQWAKLDRATAKMAAAIYKRPTLLTGREYNRVKGPDFEREGPVGAAIGSSILLLLDASGLRLLTGRAVTHNRLSLRPDFERFLTATRHNGT